MSIKRCGQYRTGQEREGEAGENVRQRNMRVKNDHRSEFSNLSNWKEEA